MNPEQAELIAERLTHAIDLLRAELNLTRASQDQEFELIRHRLCDLEKAREDHETRIREAASGVTAFKVTSGLASGGSLIALLKAFLGG